MEKGAVMCAVLVFLTVSEAEDLQTTCPAIGFTDGVSSKIECTANRTFYDNACFTKALLVTFSWYNGGSVTRLCVTSYTACETTGTPTACNSCSCQCSDRNTSTNINKYIFTFVPDASFNGGSFYCEITCTFPSRPETTEHSTCANVLIAQASTTATPPTTTAGSVDDYSLTCPKEWTDETKNLLLCIIQVNKFRPSPACPIFADTVIFIFSKDVDTKRTDCSVVNINTVCDNSINANGCGCREKNATHITIFDYVNSNRRLHENAEWHCQVQCLTNGGDPVLSTRKTPECLRTIFAPKPSTTPADAESSSPITRLVILLAVAGGLCIVMAAVWVYCIRKRRSGGQQDAPPANIPPANIPPANIPPANIPLPNIPPANIPPANIPPANIPLPNIPPANIPPANIPPANIPPANIPLANAPQVAGSAGPSTDQAAPTIPDDDPADDESNVDGSEASETSEVSAWEVGED